MRKDRNVYGIIYIMFSIHPKCSKVYVGQSTHPISYSRFSDHINDAFRKGKKEFEYKISRAIRKYGKETWKILTVDKYLKYLTIHKKSHKIQNVHLYTGKNPIFKAKSQNELDHLEILWIAEFNSYNNGYNSTLGGGGRKFVEGFSKDQITQYKELLMQGFLKTQILIDKEKKTRLKNSKNPFDNISHNQFYLRLAYSDISELELEELHQCEVSARFFNNFGRQQALANIIEIEMALGINHFESIQSNKNSFSQNLTIQELKRNTNNMGSLNEVLDSYQIKKDLQPKIIPNHTISLGRIGDIRSAIIIDLFENNRIFSQDYLREKYKSTRDIIRTSPVQRGSKRIYGNFFQVIHNWKTKSNETLDGLTIREITNMKTAHPMILTKLIEEGKKLKDYFALELNNAGKPRKEIEKLLKIPRKHLDYLSEIFTPKIAIKLDSKRWKNYNHLVFIENILINTPFISPKQLAELYFGKEYSETQRKNFSRKLNLIKKIAESKKRMSDLYLNKKIRLID